MQTLKLTNLVCENGDLVLSVILNRPDKANAMNAQMQEEITSLFKNLDPKVRLVLLSGRGKHFCAGADLQWMQASGKMTIKQNRQESKKLAEMYHSIARAHCPTIAVVKGSVMGGGVGLMAACDIVFGRQDTKFCLSEARLGILPAVIVPYLQKTLTKRQLMSLTLSSSVLMADQALRWNLVDSLFDSEEELLSLVLKKINEILLCSPSTKKNFLDLVLDLERHSTYSFGAIQQICVGVISKVRSSVEGQEGLQSFLARQDPPWETKLEWPEDFRF